MKVCSQVYSRLDWIFRSDSGFHYSDKSSGIVSRSNRRDDYNSLCSKESSLSTGDGKRLQYVVRARLQVEPFYENEYIASPNIHKQFRFDEKALFVGCSLADWQQIALVDLAGPHAHLP